MKGFDSDPLDLRRQLLRGLHAALTGPYFSEGCK
uniref:Uncharacterized protein n=1 Tax=Anguilla anguilla TaxID=7936 RepID=A0A0E9UH07_ANGAN